jgi:effector-binding domain-containing protein
VDVDVEIRDLAPQRVVTIREQATADGLGAAFRELYPVIWAYLEKQGVRPSGPSFGLFHTYSEDEVDFEAGFPVDGPVEGEGRIESKELPGGTAAVARHEGPYATIGQVHEALDRFAHQRGAGHVGPPREVYLVGPGDEDDPSKWRTEVIYLMAEA